MKLVDLYSELYEGELEAILIEKDASDNIIYKLRLWQADFSSIIGWIPYNESTHPENLARIFNRDLDWGQDFSQVNRLQEFYEQLLMIVNEVRQEDFYLFDAVKQICEDTLKKGNRLFIKWYD